MKGSSALTAAVIIAFILGAVATALTYYETQSLHSELLKQYSNLRSIEEDLHGLNAKLSSLNSSMGSMRSQLGDVGHKVSGLEGKITELSREFSNLKAGETSLKSEMLKLQEEVNEAKYPMTFTDALGRSVTVYKIPERIVSVAPSFTEILFLIGAGKQVVGVDEFSNYPPVVNQLKKNGSLKVVGGFSTINIEAVLNLKPDLVVMTGGVQAKYAKELSDMGITVLVLRSGSISDIFSDIMILGAVTGHEGKALELVKWMRNTIIETHEAVQKYLNETSQHPFKVYYELFPDYWTMGGDSYISDMLSLAGGVNIFQNVTKPYFVASPEAIMSANPDVIIINYNYGQFGTPQALMKRISSRPGWSNITAVKGDKIYVIQGGAEDIMDRPGPRAALGVAILARILYPQAFNLTSQPHIINDSVLQLWGLSVPEG